MDLFTFEDYANITQEEEQLKKLLTEDSVDSTSPSAEALENIKKYSEALSIKKTKSIGNLEMVLN